MSATVVIHFLDDLEADVKQTYRATIVVDICAERLSRDRGCLAESCWRPRLYQRLMALVELK